MRYIRNIYTLLLALTALIGTHTLAYTQESDSLAMSLNEEYEQLLKQSEYLQHKEDSLTNVVRTTRRNYINEVNSTTITNNDRAQYSAYIIELEQQVYNIRSLRGKIANRINAIEQYRIFNSLANGNKSEETSPDNITKTSNGNKRYLVHNKIFLNKLSTEDYKDLINAQANEIVVDALSKEYVATYKGMQQSAERYITEKSEDVADSLYSQYNKLHNRLGELDNQIDTYWSNILETKYNMYYYILEVDNIQELPDKMSNEYIAMMQRCANIDGSYISDALMRYVIGHQTLLDHEIDFARAMSLNEAADSLSEVKHNRSLPDYKLEPIEVERRLFIDYKPIEYDKTSFYNSLNPVPEVRIYERGTIYRILLGKFKLKQKTTIFKGVKPLYIELDKNDMHCYYAGGFATLHEAEEAQQQLKKRGFKSPEICRWHNGEMVNLDSNEIDDSRAEEQKPVATPGKRYIVNIESHSGDIASTIRQLAPNKMVSRNANGFVVGTFTDISEAEELKKALSDITTDTSITISEVELK